MAGVAATVFSGVEFGAGWPEQAEISSVLAIASQT
jgi:hypothetical protein